MVKMNTQGLQVPLGPEDLNAYLTCGRKLPNIPQTGVPVMKKKHFTDFGPGNKNHYQSLMLDSVDEESDQRPCQVQCLTLDDTESRQDDSTTVFDLVHRGRQRDQHYRALRKKATGTTQVCSPKIMTTTSPESADYRNVQINTSMPNGHARSTRGLGVSGSQSSQGYLLGRKNLSLNYRTG